VVYVYAIAQRGNVPPAQTGLGGAPIRVVAASDLVAVVSDCRGPDVVASGDALWIHETVVEELMLAGTVLPMRLGTVLPNDAAVRKMLTSDRDELLDGLERVRDAVEVAVHVTWPPGGEGASDTAHLLDRLGRTRRAIDFAARMDVAIAELARASKRQVVTSAPELVLTCAYLVDRARLEEFRDCVERLGSELDGATILCTGPWPPYSFAAEQHEAKGLEG
jgi:hypothetical protein